MINCTLLNSPDIFDVKWHFLIMVDLKKKEREEVQMERDTERWKRKRKKVPWHRTKLTFRQVLKVFVYVLRDSMQLFCIWLSGRGGSCSGVEFRRTDMQLKWGIIDYEHRQSFNQNTSGINTISADIHFLFKIKFHRSTLMRIDHHATQKNKTNRNRQPCNDV